MLETRDRPAGTFCRSTESEAEIGIRREPEDLPEAYIYPNKCELKTQRGHPELSWGGYFIVPISDSEVQIQIQKLLDWLGRKNEPIK